MAGGVPRWKRIGCMDSHGSGRKIRGVNALKVERSEWRMQIEALLIYTLLLTVEVFLSLECYQ